MVTVAVLRAYLLQFDPTQPVVLTVGNPHEINRVDGVSPVVLDVALADLEVA